MAVPARTIYVPRMLRRFENQAGTIIYNFPALNAEYESEQGLTLPDTPIIGADYGFDHLGITKGIKGYGTERVRMSIYSKCDVGDIDTEFDNLKSKLYRAGLGKGFSQSYSGNRRWAKMRLSEMPFYAVMAIDQPSSAKLLGATAIFKRESDWYGEDAIIDNHLCTAVTQTYTVNNPGNAVADNLSIVLQPLTAAGYTNPVVENLTNLDKFSTNRDSTATTSRVKLDPTIPFVGNSTTSGASYTDDFANYILPAITQRPLTFHLEPGDNSIRVTSIGVPNFRVFITFYPQYH